MEPSRSVASRAASYIAIPLYAGLAGKDQVPRGPARAEGAFDRRGQAGVGPVAGQAKVGPAGAGRGALGVLGGGGGEGGALLLDHLPGRQGVGQAMQLRHVGPELGGEALAVDVQ